MNVYVARQPILNQSKETVAYELLFRDGLQNSMNYKINGYAATQKILSNSMVAFGIGKLASNKKVFVNFTEQNITNGDVELLPPEMVVIEILENTEPTAPLLAKCKELKNNGYTFALDDFVFEPKYQPFIDLADIVKIDFLITHTAEERKKIRQIIPPHVKLLAEKVETLEEYEQALSFGYELFQGYFFCKPVIISEKTARVDITAQFMLMREMNSTHVDINRIENIIKNDLSLIHKLLKYINSPYIGIPNEVRNLRQAIALLGINGVRNWVNLVCIRDLSSEKPNELFVILLIRAKFCELTTENISAKNSEKDTAFLIGMLSLSDVVLDQPIEKIIDELGLAPEIKAALLFRQNDLGQLLNMVTDYEHGDWMKVKNWCHENNFSEELLASLYNEVIHWATKMNEDINGSIQ
ncbi:EAL and HDOD domain-containing protein [Pectinatus haikarae]|uniref:EAL and HDOD domain-containing protein n=1 Tax=Pectinatus haikarae TaxID=349096 RepID=UPI0018C85AB4|nr:HDOD domain-containing protein [Pectinatus haikarae]